MDEYEFIVYDKILSLVHNEGLYHYDSLRIDLTEEMNPDSNIKHMICVTACDRLINEYSLLNYSGNIVTLTITGRIAQKIGFKYFLILHYLASPFKHILNLIK